ncbi:MAG: aspartate/glutamate racemase family protein, partial [Lachnospiraceae bacterium]|nr:aspartate/glutamate racemase family protein [Lachnospiraceae bacterium]
GCCILDKFNLRVFVMKKLGLVGGMGPESTIPYRHDIEIVTPTVEEMEYINRKISSELELGVIKAETLENFQKIIERMKKDDGMEAVILGCTELPLLLNDKVSPVPCLDTMKIHVKALVDRIVA